ncbi:MAG TPA: DUF2249 domain-containing protein [Verrucomicrobiae bacterium]|nr:DUF2249 domain-containing protein [Verrucomicrobiae bacterium]
MSSEIVTLDVRDDLRNGSEPFSKIMYIVGQLRPGERLSLLVPFEPVPLFAVMMQRGFAHEARQLPDGDWEVLFTRNGGEKTIEAGQPAVRRHSNGSRDKSSEIIEVDARGLEPPQPMVKILETLAALPEGAELRARTDRRPMHLYTRIEMRGFKGETEEQTDGSFLTHIRRA